MEFPVPVPVRCRGRRNGNTVRRRLISTFAPAAVAGRAVSAPMMGRKLCERASDARPRVARERAGIALDRCRSARWRCRDGASRQMVTGGGVHESSGTGERAESFVQCRVTHVAELAQFTERDRSACGSECGGDALVDRDWWGRWYVRLLNHGE